MTVKTLEQIAETVAALAAKVEALESENRILKEAVFGEQTNGLARHVYHFEEQDENVIPVPPGTTSGSGKSFALFGSVFGGEYAVGSGGSGGYSK